MATRKGPPKHQNKVAWKADAGIKKNDKELGGKLHPYPPISGVCPRCRDQIQWRRKYGKYKALKEPSKCNNCSKRAVRQAYHALCTACAKERNVCAKCCQPSQIIVGKDADEEKEQQEILEHALRNLRERDRRTLLRAMSSGTPSEKTRVKLEKAKIKATHTEESEESEVEETEESEAEEDEECESEEDEQSESLEYEESELASEEVDLDANEAEEHRNRSIKKASLEKLVLH